MLLELWSREDGKGPFHTTRHARQRNDPSPTSVAIERPNLTHFRRVNAIGFLRELDRRLGA